MTPRPRNAQRWTLVVEAVFMVRKCIGSDTGDAPGTVGALYTSLRGGFSCERKLLI